MLLIACGRVTRRLARTGLLENSSNSSNLLSKRARSAGRGHAEHTAEERLKAELQGPSLLSAWSSSGIAEPLHVLSA